jgi:ABC-2 type transport system permease protein
VAPAGVVFVRGKNLFIIAKKDLGELANEKTILLAIALQLIVALFSSFLFVGLTSLYDPSSIGGYSGTEYQIAYSGADSPLRELLSQREDFNVYEMDLSPAIAALKERKFVAVIYVPDTRPDAAEPVTITVYTIRNDIQAAIVDVKLKETFLSYEEELRTIRADRLQIIPVSLEFPAASNTTSFYEFVYTLLIPLLLFMPAVISSALIIDLITEEYQHHTLDTLLSAPVSIDDVVWGKILACFLLIPLQAGAWLILLLINGISIAGVPLVLSHVLIASLALILIGALTALYYRERTAAQVIFSLVFVVLMLFVLAVPGNPFNQVAILATGGSDPRQWPVLALLFIVTLVLGFLTHVIAARSAHDR